MSHRGEPLMTYDALLLSADEDHEIVDDMMTKLHNSLQVGDKCVSLPYNKSSKILLKVIVSVSLFYYFLCNELFVK